MLKRGREVCAAGKAFAILDEEDAQEKVKYLVLRLLGCFRSLSITALPSTWDSFTSTSRLKIRAVIIGDRCFTVNETPHFPLHVTAEERRHTKRYKQDPFSCYSLPRRVDENEHCPPIPVLA